MAAPSAPSMNTLSTLIESQNPSWFEQLSRFCDMKAASWSFASVDEGGVEAKERLLATLWKALTFSDRDPSGPFRGSGCVLQLMNAIRLILREDGNINAVSGPEVLAYFLRAANLIPRNVPEEMNADRCPEVTVEALKVVINLVTKIDKNRALFVQFHHAEIGLIKMLQEAKLQDSPDLLFLLYRLLAQVTLDENNAKIIRSIGDSDVLKICFRDISLVPVFDANGAEIVLLPTFLHEAFTAVFNLTLHLGRLKGDRALPTETELQIFKEGSKYMGIILETRSDELKLLRQAVASCLINSPKGWSNLVSLEHLIRAVNYFLEAVRDSVGNSHFQFDAESVVPHLMLLTGTMQEDQTHTIRKMVLDLVFPPEYRNLCGEPCIEGPDILRSSSCLGAKLAHFMTSPYVAVKHFVQEFFYQACGEDANLLCSLVGVGNAAGLLQEKGLLGNFAQFFHSGPTIS